MASNMRTEEDKGFDIVGSPSNPAREPAKASKEWATSLGGKALKDSLIIVVAAWAILLFLNMSLRHHNV